MKAIASPYSPTSNPQADSSPNVHGSTERSTVVSRISAARGTRPPTPLNINIVREDEVIRTSSDSPPRYSTRTPLYVRGIAYHEASIDPEPRVEPYVVEEHLKTSDSIQSASTKRGGAFSAREHKRWDKELPLAPPDMAAPNLPDSVKFFRADQADRDDISLFSALTADDAFGELEGLHDSVPYLKWKQTRAARLNRENQFRRRREALEEQKRHRNGSRRDPDLNAIIPTDSISQVGKQTLQNIEQRKMTLVNEDESLSSSKKHQFGHSTVPKPQPHTGSGLSPLPVSPTATASIPLPAGTEKPSKNLIETGLQIAGKVTRFLLAAPSDPKLKTYSKRFPPTDDAPASWMKRNGMGSDNSHSIMDEAPTTSRVMPVENLDKGKGKVVDNHVDATVDRLDFALEGLQSYSPLGNEAHDGPSEPPNSSQSQAPVSALPKQHTKCPIIDSIHRRHATIYFPSEVSSANTRWPDEDSSHNIILTSPLRGGGFDDRSVSLTSASIPISPTNIHAASLNSISHTSYPIETPSSVTTNESTHATQRLGPSSTSSKKAESKEKGKMRSKRSLWGDEDYAIAVHGLSMHKMM